MINIHMRPVPGYEGLYLVTNTGMVVSVERKVKKANGREQKVAGRVLKPSYYRGYQKVVLYSGNTGKTFFVHRLVYSAYYGLSPHETIDHIDGVKHNNHIDNLAPMSREENTRRMWDRIRGVEVTSLPKQQPVSISF